MYRMSGPLRDQAKRAYNLREAVWSANTALEAWVLKCESLIAEIWSKLERKNSQQVKLRL